MNKANADSGKPDARSSGALTWPLILLVVVVGGGGVLVVGTFVVGRWLAGSGSLPPALTTVSANANETIQASNSTSKTASKLTPAGASVACGRLILLNESDHPLMRQVGKLLHESLVQEGVFESVDYFPWGSKVAAGSTADVFARIDLKAVKVDTSLPKQHLEATIAASLGSQLAEGSHHVTDHLSPPIVEFDANLTLQHTSDATVGSADTFNVQAANIVKQLSKSNVGEMKEMLDKHGALSQLPDAFYPSYQPVPEKLDFAFLNAELVGSFARPLTQNETYWRVPARDAPLETFQEIATRLEADGWVASELPKEFTPWTQFNLKKNEDRIGVFAVRTGSRHDGDAADKPVRLWIRYLDRMSQEELRTAVQSLIDSQASAEAILQFNSVLSREQREALVARLQAKPPQSHSGWLALARYYRGNKQESEAAQALAHAWLLAELTRSNSGVESVKSLAKKWKIKPPTRRSITSQQLRNVPIPEVAADANTLLPLNVGVPVLFFVEDGKQDWVVWTIRVDRPNKDAQKLFIGRMSSGVSSWGTRDWRGQQSTSFRHDIDGKGQVEVTISGLGADGKGTVEAKLIAAEPDAEKPNTTDAAAT